MIQGSLHVSRATLSVMLTAVEMYKRDWSFDTRFAKTHVGKAMIVFVIQVDA